MKNIIILIGILAASFGLRAQTGSIAGQVQNADNQPQGYVNIGLLGTSNGTITDEAGRFEIKNVKPGSYTLETSYVGYQSESVKVIVKENQVTNLPTIQIRESVQNLDEVIVEDTQDNPYKNDVISNSLKLKTPILETPQNIQTVTEGMLANQQVISMSDGLIRNVSGTARISHWGDMFTKINMRGSRVQAFRNGMNAVNSYWGPLTEDMSYVDHIEFVKGPAGFMLANGDPSGLYNVVTKKPTGNTGGSVGFTMGSFDLYRATVDLDGKLSKDGRLLYRLNLAAQNKGSHRPNEFNNRYSMAPVLSYQLDDKTKITAEYALQRADMSDVGSFYVFSTEGYATLPRDFTSLPKGLNPTKINDQSFFLNLQHDFNDRWKLTVQTAYFKYQQKGSDLWPAAVNADGTMIRAVYNWDAESDMTRAQAFINGEEKTGNITHRFLGGIDIGSNSYVADWNQYHALDSVGAEFDTNNPNYGTPVNGFPDFDQSSSTLRQRASNGGAIDQQYSGIYLQDELGFLANKIRLTLAGRYSTVSNSSYGGEAEEASHFTPRVGLSATVTKQTTVYALYDQAFVPQSGQLANGGEVKPITGNNMEVGIKRDWMGGQWSTTFSAYKIVKKNELTGDPANPTSGLSVVLGEKTAQGVEFDLKGNIAEGLDLIANYAYTDSKVTQVTEGVTAIEEGDVIPGFAKHTANGWLTYTMTKGPLAGTGISLGTSYMVDRAMSNWSESDDIDNLPDYFKLDGGLSWSQDKIRVNFNVYNILDEYLYDGSYYQWLSAYYWQSEPGRNYRLSINYSF